MPKNSNLYNYSSANKLKKSMFKRNKPNDLRNKITKNIPMCLENDIEVNSSSQVNRVRLHEGGFGWYRVMILYGAKYDRQYILEQLENHCESMEFKIYACHKIGSTLSCHVDNYQLADRIRGLSGQITLPDSRRMEIRVYSGIPKVIFNNSLKELLKEVLTKRYDNVNKLLNLERFHSDPAFENQFCAIFNMQTCEEIFTLITNHIPDLIGLNLSNNYINSFYRMTRFIRKLKCLSILDISNNRINNVNELNAFTNLPITDLILNGNPIEKYYENDHNSCSSVIRKTFPKIVRLNRFELPPVVSFEIDSVGNNLPESVPTCLSCPDAGPTIQLFLKQYFEIYDSDNREHLLNAYSNDCKFSLTTAYLNNVQGKQPSLRAYYGSNRNLLRSNEPYRRQKTLKIGKLQTVAQINDLPKTKHDMSSFKIDMGAYTNEFFHLNVSGVFREIDTNEHRYFSKTMIMIPFGSGICIANELLHITNHVTDIVKSMSSICI